MTARWWLRWGANETPRMRPRPATLTATAKLAYYRPLTGPTWRYTTGGGTTP